MMVLNMQDRDMLARYMTLSLADRKTVCDVVALAVAATVTAALTASGAADAAWGKVGTQAVVNGDEWTAKP